MLKLKRRKGKLDYERTVNTIARISHRGILLNIELGNVLNPSKILLYVNDSGVYDDFDSWRNLADFLDGVELALELNNTKGKTD